MHKSFAYNLVIILSMHKLHTVYCYVVELCHSFAIFDFGGYFLLFSFFFASDALHAFILLNK